MERTISLKYLKILLDTDLKVILMDHQNNYVEVKLIARISKFFYSIAHHA